MFPENAAKIIFLAYFRSIVYTIQDQGNKIVKLFQAITNSPLTVIYLGVVGMQEMEKESEKYMENYLKPTSAIDSDNGSIIETAGNLTKGCSTDAEKAVKLFYFVRDSVHYNVFMISVFKEDFVASRVLKWGKGYCVQKAGIPGPEVGKGLLCPEGGSSYGPWKGLRHSEPHVVCKDQEPSRPCPCPSAA